MFKIFNSIQVVIFFALSPMLISWLNTSPFAYAGGLKWLAILFYVGAAIWLTAAQVIAIDKA